MSHKNQLHFEVRIQGVVNFVESKGITGKKKGGFLSKRCIAQNGLSNTIVKQSTRTKK